MTHLDPRRALLTVALTVLAACEPDPASPFDVPLQPESPWPKFRRDSRQTGQSPLRPRAGGSRWAYATGKGIFSSPVVGGDGTIYIGSADRYFYALNPDGTLRWRVLTGEIIDSAALLDDAGRVFFGSGDGRLRALDAATGDERWSFQADDPAVTGGLIRWFEGNVALGPDGTLLVPNDNFHVYALDRETGAVRWRFLMADQTWSLAAVDARSGVAFIGNNSLMSLLGADNVYALDLATGEAIWSQSILGSVAASPMLTPDGLVVVGGFDGFVHAYEQGSGRERWTFATRDHVYASPGLLPDGTIIQPSADGTVYALDPATGALRWAFDALEPIRSSPAIDADGNVYLGSGEGKLFVLHPDGTLRWSLVLASEARNDLNASPALGVDAIYLAGEDGVIHSVPFDHCLEGAGAADPGCFTGGEALPAGGARLLLTSPFGAPLLEPPAEIRGNAALAFSLFVREAGDTVLAAIDSSSVEVTVDPPVPVDVDVSGDRKFVTVTPRPFFAPAGDQRVTLRLAGTYLVDLERDGLRQYGGTPGGTFDETFALDLAEPSLVWELPYPIPDAPGDPAGVLELYRLAAPLPTILPSYNQIGFDSLHYLIGLVAPGPEGAIGWVVGGRLARGENVTEVDPETKAVFPVEIRWQDGEITLVNADGFALEVMNATIGFQSFRIAAALDDTGRAAESADLLVRTRCAEVEMYGVFLGALGFCNPQTDLLVAYGAAELRPHGTGVQTAPTGLGTATFLATADAVTVDLDGPTLLLAEHHVGLLLVDRVTGRPVTIDYGLDTERVAGAGGEVAQVTVSFAAGSVPAALRAYLMVDAYPAARADVDLP